MNRVIAITGGIGSGKSVVSQVLRAMGYLVYDCDVEAKRIMNDCKEIPQAIIKAFGEDLIIAGEIDKSKLAEIVFNDKDKLRVLNGIVHPFVKIDFGNWVASHYKEDIVFVETAILYESDLASQVDGVWEVVAPEDVRIERVMNRSHISLESVKARINSQSEEFAGRKHIIINNDGNNAILPQINKLILNVKECKLFDETGNECYICSKN